ncbi:MAG TPA: hypothetical protein PLO06_10220, partial [Methanoregulaceae archaeon]|nr:hypothetical protein [Methanoregulaceae archaeon]
MLSLLKENVFQPCSAISGLDLWFFNPPPFSPRTAPGVPGNGRLSEFSRPIGRLDADGPPQGRFALPERAGWFKLFSRELAVKVVERAGTHGNLHDIVSLLLRFPQQLRCHMTIHGSPLHPADPDDQDRA